MKSKYKKNIKPKPLDTSYPIIEIQLDGKVLFEQLIDAIYYRFEIPYQLLSADILYEGTKNYGKLVIQLQGNELKNNSLLQYFKNQEIQSRLC